VVKHAPGRQQRAQQRRLHLVVRQRQRRHNEVAAPAPVGGAVVRVWVLRQEDGGGGVARQDRLQVRAAAAGEG
jgi:hypothetical protein